MKLSEETLENFEIGYPLDRLAPPEKALFLDIETTGFTAKSSYLYLIGCAYLRGGSWHTIQWLAEDYEQEKDLLNAFLAFARDYEYLIQFNGTTFDLPFLAQKCEQLGIEGGFDTFKPIDLYRCISPYKYFLKLPNCKQKTLEQYLGIDRKDVFTGGELIGIYHDYVKNANKFAERSLFLHNADDVKGMLEILPILADYDLFREGVRARKVQENTYREPDGPARRELVITVTFPTPLPCPVSAAAGGCTFAGAGSEGVIKVPVFTEEMKYFYANYRDYYYLPAEDVSLHKSVAGFVDREHRVQATAATCYTRKYSEYLPQWGDLFKPFFKREYKSRELFFELTDELKKDRPAFTAYANHILHMIASVY